MKLIEMAESVHDKYAKYPFLAIGGQYLIDQSIDLEKIITDPDFTLILEKAYHRIEVAADGKIYRSDVNEDEFHGDKADKSEITSLRETLSFVIAIVLLKLSCMNTLIKRFSLAEARRAEKYLKHDLIGPPKSDNRFGNLEERTKRPLEIMKELFSVNIQRQSDYFTVPIFDYLKNSVNFHEREWKLVNRQVENGLVYLSADETVRLFREQLNNRIYSKINSVNSPPMSETFRKYVDGLIKLAKKFPTQTISSTEYPPCIKHAIEVLEKGENLPHSGRFMLATFLLGKGQTVEQIAPLFKNAPDYNEKVTLYQLNHLAGSTGNATKYSCPSCDKVKSQNLCFAIPECDNIINPLQFGKKKTLNA